jgi:hypothetical protein
LPIAARDSRHTRCPGDFISFRHFRKTRPEKSTEPLSPNASPKPAVLKIFDLPQQHAPRSGNAFSTFLTRFQNGEKNQLLMELIESISAKPLSANKARHAHTATNVQSGSGGIWPSDPLLLL